MMNACLPLGRLRRNTVEIGVLPLIPNVLFCDKKYVWILKITAYFCRSIKPIF